MSIFRHLIASSRLQYPSLSLHFPPPSMTPHSPPYIRPYKSVVKNMLMSQKIKPRRKCARTTQVVMKKDEGRKNPRSKKSCQDARATSTRNKQPAAPRYARSRSSSLSTSKTPNTSLHTNSAQLHASPAPSTSTPPPGGPSIPIATLILSLSKHARHTPPPYTLVCLRHPSPVTTSPTTSTPAAVLV